MIRQAALVVVLVLGLTLFASVGAHAQTECPAVPADGAGVERIEGQGSYSFYGIPTMIVDQPAIALIDDGLSAQGDRESMPSPAGQVLGALTSDFFTTPFSYTINLPLAGNGLQVDLDQNGAQNVGVQVYQVALAQNIFNSVPLVGLAQAGILASYHRDPVSNEIVEGAIVVYAPDDQQGFPCGYGDDGKLFTADDPIVTLPQGFTVANIKNGTITFDRSPVARVDINDGPSGATLDFSSDQDIVKSFNTLIDFLKARYVFNEFYHIDWDALQAKYQPWFEQAAADNNVGEYFIALVDLAHDVADAHVYVQPGDMVADPVAMKAARAQVPALGGGVRAELVELNDGRVIVTNAPAGGPAATAGFTFGTEILSVDGLPVNEALDIPVRTLEYPGTPESRRIERVQYLLKRAPGTAVEVAYKQPDTTEVLTTVLTTTTDIPRRKEAPLMPVEYKLVDGVGYVTWPAFERTGIATHIFADFIKVMNQRQIPGIVIDLRGNGGGSVLLENAVMSYLFSADKPLTFGVADNYTYDTISGKFVRTPQTLKLSSPPGAQPYLGDVVVLVDQECASACEFLSYWLKANERAAIVGQYSTEGAGGNTNAVYLPGGIMFNYTEGTILDNKTNQPAFQAVGVEPDVRVPVTEETERAKVEGGDPVLDAGIQHLRRMAFERLDLQPAPFAGGTITTVVPTSWKATADGSAYAGPDQPISIAVMALPAEVVAEAGTDPDAIMLSIVPDVKKASEFKTEAATWEVYAGETGEGSKAAYTVYGLNVIDGVPYLVTVTTSNKDLVSLIVEFIFAPAMQGFTVVK